MSFHSLQGDFSLFEEDEKYDSNPFLGCNSFAQPNNFSPLFLDINHCKNESPYESQFIFKKENNLEEYSEAQFLVPDKIEEIDKSSKKKIIGDENDFLLKDSLLHKEIPGSPLYLLTTDNSGNINNIFKEDNNTIKNSSNNNISFKINDNFSDIFISDFFCKKESNSINIFEPEEDEEFNKGNFFANMDVDLSDSTSLPLAIINLMKNRNSSLDINTIVDKLESKKDTFRKANGSKYKNDFRKVIESTLNTSGLFYKVGFNDNNSETNKYYFIEEQEKQYLKKKRNISNYSSVTNKNNKIFYITKNRSPFMPIKVKIQIDKVNKTIKKMENKYKGDSKYINVIFCLDMFKSLLQKYLFFVKMDKVNSLYDLTILNDKIMKICHTLEKLEKNEIFFPQKEEIIQKINEYNKENKKNIMFVDGSNNFFNEPPSKKKKLRSD